jgi:REP element-mobilizing transposase RayT
MPKKKLVRDSEFPYHISARCNNKDWFNVPMPVLWRIFSDYLYLMHLAFDLEIHAFVLMNNHFHLVARTPNANIDAIMNYFQRETSKVIATETGRINHIYGGPYNPSLIREPRYYINAYKYVLRNPVDAQLCSKVEEYPYSTLSGVLGLTKLTIPVFGNDELFYNTENFLKWLNTEYEENVSEVIRKGLKRREFKTFRCRKTDRLIELPEGP